jgi:hypothetical protein
MRIPIDFLGFILEEGFHSELQDLIPLTIWNYPEIPIKTKSFSWEKDERASKLMLLLWIPFLGKEIGRIPMN